MNLDKARAQAFVKYAKEGFYLDGSSKKTIVRLITYNGQHHLFASTTVEFDHSVGGSIDVDIKVRTYSVEPYARANSGRVFVEVLFVLCFFLNAAYEAWQLKEADSPVAHFSSFWNVVDVINLAIFGVIIGYWLNFYSHTKKFQPEERYGVYADVSEYQRGNYLAHNEKELGSTSQNTAQCRSCSGWPTSRCTRTCSRSRRPSSTSCTGSTTSGSRTWRWAPARWSG